MREIIDDCVGCDAVFGYCKGVSCPYYGKYAVLICDECGEETDKLFQYDGNEICLDCLSAKMNK